MRQVELVMVTENNNNKVYRMTELENGTWRGEWGRVGYDLQSKIYPIRSWDSKYREKVNKGYKDITSLRADAVQKFSYSEVQDSSIQNLLSTLHSYAKKALSDNYTISAENVTTSQINTAQKIINELATTFSQLSSVQINEKLKELYTTIPRKMKDVRLHLLNFDQTQDEQKSFTEQTIALEQDLLDVMSQQVSMTQQPVTQNQTLADALGIEISHPDNTEIETIKKMMSDKSKIFKNAFKIENTKTQPLFENQKIKSVKQLCKLLFHGSRNENWMSIVKTGLLIRPSGVVLTGAMFGHGVYFSDKFEKSLGYTSFSGSYWARGNSSHAFLAIYEVNTGMELQVERHENWMYSLNEQNLKSKGEYDSLFAKGGYELRV